jgi:hydroxymethylpyrimidine pyrophosphatase-like HAD family hydrolase
VNNGALVKDLASSRTLHHHYLPAEVYPEVLALARSVGPPLVYVDAYPEQTDFLTERSGSLPRRGPARPRRPRRVVEDLAHSPREGVIMASLMADGATLAALRERARVALGPRVHTHVIQNKNYRGEILEFLSPESGKWAALARVAEQAGIAPEAIAAIGDDCDDRCSPRGLRRVMGNAVEGAKPRQVLLRAATEGGVEAIRRVLLAD